MKQLKFKKEWHFKNSFWEWWVSDGLEMTWMWLEHLQTVPSDLSLEGAGVRLWPCRGESAWGLTSPPSPLLPHSQGPGLWAGTEPSLCVYVPYEPASSNLDVQKNNLEGLKRDTQRLFARLGCGLRTFICNKLLGLAGAAWSDHTMRCPGLNCTLTSTANSRPRSPSGPRLLTCCPFSGGRVEKKLTVLEASWAPFG